jgi:hypothetical protein
VHIPSRAKYLLFSIYAIKQRYKHEAGGDNWGNQAGLQSYEELSAWDGASKLCVAAEVQYDIVTQIDKLEVIDREVEIEDAR